LSAAAVVIPIVAAGVGNTSLQFGVIEFGRTPVPQPRQHHTFPIINGDPQFAPPAPDDYRHWIVASVHPPATQRLRAWAEKLGAESFHVLTNDEFPIASDVEVLDQVGSDRLAAAVAVNRLRDPSLAAIFVDAGTALTVNAISADGVFLGGAILPGAGTSLAALEKATQQLPKVELDLKNSGEPPRPIGKHTRAAIRSGVYWGLVGAARQLIEQMSEELQSQPQLFVTGGFGPWLSAELMGQAGGERIEKVEFVPHLVLSGVALTAEALGV
jgi:type III pantothenate kinase